jgi:hypothetical protein
MATEFKFKSGKKTITIEGKEYVLDIGNKDKLKTVLSKLGEIEKLGDAMDAKSPEVVDKLVALEEEIVTATVGDWERLWVLAEENVFAMLGLVRTLSELLTESVNEVAKGYGL